MVFVNVLAFLLLATAGFARLTDHRSPALPTPDGGDARLDITSIGSTAQGSVSITEEVISGPTRLEDFEPLRNAPESTFEQDILFVDELPEAERPPTGTPASPDVEELAGQQIAAVGVVVTPAALSAERAVGEPIGEPVSAPDPAVVTAPVPVPVAPAVQPEKQATPSLALPETGDLEIRSNVANDQVYVNGKSRGSSGKRLSLPPGEYEIVVAKDGYRSWRSVVDLARGDRRTLVVSLERITRVHYQNGVWEHGVTSGSGTYLKEDGSRYEGDFLNGKFHGRGRLMAADQLTYDGEWFAGNKNGAGTLRRPDGSTYVGEFRDDQFNGQGTLTESDGTIWSGYWINGRLNGDGSYTARDGTLYTGGFVDGKYQGNGSITYPDGTYYEGSFANGQYQGKGQLTFPDGKKYSGNFLENQFHGQGDLMNPNGSKITGSFKFGKPFGVVTLTTAEGEVFTARTDNPGVCYRLKSYRATECPVLEGW